jgi:hypothetical protein
MRAQKGDKKFIKGDMNKKTFKQMLKENVAAAALQKAPASVVLIEIQVDSAGAHGSQTKDGADTTLDELNEWGSRGHVSAAGTLVEIRFIRLPSR